VRVRPLALKDFATVLEHMRPATQQAEEYRVTSSGLGGGRGGGGRRALLGGAPGAACGAAALQRPQQQPLAPAAPLAGRRLLLCLAP
jgi:hypothetical protein